MKSSATGSRHKERGDVRGLPSYLLTNLPVVTSSLKTMLFNLLGSSSLHSTICFVDKFPFCFLCWAVVRGALCDIVGALLRCIRLDALSFSALAFIFSALIVKYALLSLLHPYCLRCAGLVILELILNHVFSVLLRK